MTNIAIATLVYQDAKIGWKQKNGSIEQRCPGGTKCGTKMSPFSF